MNLSEIIERIKRDQTRLVIVRGIPGSGKSRLADKIIHAVRALGFACDKFEADDHFVGQDGVYRFNPKRVGLAHEHCQLKALRHLVESNGVTIVSNTFTRKSEVDGYMHALFSPERFLIVKCVGEYQNTHGVPSATVEKMKARWENIDGEITYTGDES